MTRTISVVLIDGNRDYRALLEEQLSAEAGFEILASVGDGAAGLAAILAHRPDIVITELILSGLDGIGLLERLSQVEHPPRTIVLSNWMSEARINDALRHGAGYFMGKPCDFASLRRRIAELADASEVPAASNAEAIAADCLQRLGVSPARCDTLVSMICIILAEPTCLQALSRKLYSRFLRDENDSPKRIESNLRYAIQEAWSHGSLSFQQELFGDTVARSSGRPSNGDFLAVVSRYVRSQLDSQRHPL